MRNIDYLDSRMQVWSSAEWVMPVQDQTNSSCPMGIEFEGPAGQKYNQRREREMSAEQD